MIPHEAIRTFLANAGLGLIPGTYLFGPEVAYGPNVERNAVFVMPGGGASPRRNMGEDEIARGIVNVRIRWMSFPQGDALANQIILALQNEKVAGLLYVEPTESEPDYVGIGEQGIHMWTLGFITYRERLKNG